MERSSGLVIAQPEVGFVFKVKEAAARSVATGKEKGEGEGGMPKKLVHKVFFNITHSDKIDPAAAGKPGDAAGAEEEATGDKDAPKKGTHWRIPYSYVPVRQDKDKQGLPCTVVDIVVASSTMTLATGDERFKGLVVQTAVEAFQEREGVKLDYATISPLTHKKYWGSTEGPAKVTLRDAATNPIPSFNTPVPPAAAKMAAAVAQPKAKGKAKVINNRKPLIQEVIPTTEPSAPAPGPEVPPHHVVHRGQFDLGDHTQSRISPLQSRPQHLVYSIELKRLESIAGVDLDVTSRHLGLVAGDKYKLDLDFPFPVHEDDGSARFDKATRVLTVTLPVVKPEPQPLPRSATPPPVEEEEEEEAEEEAVVEEKQEVPEDNYDNEDEISEEEQEESFAQVSEAEEEVSIEEEKQEDEFVMVDRDVLESGLTLSWQGIVPGSDGTPPELPAAKGGKRKEPQYSFRQDGTTVTLVLRVAAVDAKSVLCTVTPGEVHMAFDTAKESFLLHLRLSNEISPPSCCYDVSGSNVCVLLKKKQANRHWESLETFIDPAPAKKVAFEEEEEKEEKKTEETEEAGAEDKVKVANVEFQSDVFDLE